MVVEPHPAMVLCDRQACPPPKPKKPKPTTAAPTTTTPWTGPRNVDPDEILRATDTSTNDRSAVGLSVHLSVSLYSCRSLCTPVCLSVQPSVSVQLSVSLYSCRSLCTALSLSVGLSVQLSVSLYSCRSLCTAVSVSLFVSL